MLVGRERNIPCIVGSPDAVAALKPYQGQMVTLDGLKRRVYVGKRNLVEASAQELDTLFAVHPLMKLPPDDESRAFLEKFNRGFTDGADFWVGVTEHPLAPAWCELLANGMLALREKILASVRPGDYSAALCNETRVRNNIVHDRMQPLVSTLSMFDGFSLADLQQLVSLRERALADYMDACQRPTATFADYSNALRVFHAHKWISWFFRTHVERLVSEAANTHGISSFHIEQLLEQAQLSSIQDGTHYSGLRAVNCDIRVCRPRLAAVPRY